MLMGLWLKKMLNFAGLDARAAAVVMRVMRNIADTGRTITCTIHQPSIDIFEVGNLFQVGPETIACRLFHELLEVISPVMFHSS